jgi:hypothetical protein
MTKRLQVLLPDPEYREIQRIARSRRISIAQWVRQALHAAKREEPLGDVSKKLEALRAAAKFEFPTADIEQMLAEIEQGYKSSHRP